MEIMKVGPGVQCARTVIVRLRVLESVEIDAPHSKLGSLRRTDFVHDHLVVKSNTQLVTPRKHLIHEIKHREKNVF